MQFTSFSFFLFAALTLVLYFAVPKRIQWWVLLASSVGFYALSGIEYLGFILYTAGVTYLTGVVLQRRADREDAYVDQNRETLSKAERKAYRNVQRKKRFWVLLAGLFFGFGMLAVLKYTSFVMSNVRSVWTAFGGESFAIPSLLLPLGISF
ncbi:MAG: MBOAT family protein, partial [Clostridia bacterium]|nr:MBOAT family protein [Clostridia bacterium]